MITAFIQPTTILVERCASRRHRNQSNVFVSSQRTKIKSKLPRQFVFRRPAASGTKKHAADFKRPTSLFNCSNFFWEQSTIVSQQRRNNLRSSREVHLGQRGRNNGKLCAATAEVCEPIPPKPVARASPVLEWLEKVGDFVASFYWLWILIGALVAVKQPSTFSLVTGQAYTFGLFVIMMSMGLTLTRKDFVKAFKQPAAVAAGCLLQYTVMPLMGFLMARLAGVSAEVAVGMILVSCCPGGAASNVVTHIAKGSVTLSVVLTSCSTLMAAVMTPLLVLLLAGTYVPVSTKAIAADVLQVVLLPVVTGVLLAEVMSPKVRTYVSSAMPSVAVLTSTLLTSSALAQCAPMLHPAHQAAQQALTQTALGVVAMHAFGFLFGYQLSKLMGFSAQTNRTVSIEVGMQSSVMALALASKHFTTVSTQLPCALSAVSMNLMGAGLAFFFRHVAQQETIKKTFQRSK